MKLLRLLHILFTASIVLTYFSSIPLLAQQNENEEDEDAVDELSPFVLEEGVTSGYRATNTLAGSRLKTPLRDVGSAIQVITDDFFQDTGATDATTILSYTLNTEIGGPLGNFAGGGVDRSGRRTDQNSARINPQNNQRLRGLRSASLTRDFFLTDIPFDTYNSSSVTINRGPNSILFGVGNPGGIIDNPLNNASLTENFGEITGRYGDNDTYRATIDYNQVVIKDRLAVRVSGLQEKSKFDQKPAFEKDRRVYLAVEGVLFKNEKSNFLGKTTMRGKVEFGDIQSNPPMVIPPRDLFSFWFNGLQTDFEKFTGSPPDERLLPGNFVPKATVSLDKTPEGIFQGNQPTFAWTPIFDQPVITFQQPNATVPDGNIPSIPEAEGFQGRLNFPRDGGGFTRFEYFVSSDPAAFANFALGFAPSVIQDRRIFDFEKLLFSGNTSRVDRDLTDYNVALEQLFFKDKRAGFEVAFNKQEWEPFWQLPVDDSLVSVFSNSDVAIDISEKFGTGEPNPNLGRPLVRLFNTGSFTKQRIDRTAARVTAFYELDFETMLDKGLGKWLGTHTFTGFWGTQRATRETRNFRSSVISDTVNMRHEGFTGNKSSFFRTLNTVVFLGPSVLDASGPEDVRINPINIPIPKDGDVFNIAFQGANGNPGFNPEIRNGRFEVDTFLFSGNLTRTDIDSRAFILQNKFLKGHIATLFGWRHDESTTYGRLTTGEILELTGTSSRRTPEGDFKEENFILRDEPDSVESGNTFTKSIVAHIPESLTSFLPLQPKFSFHYAESENFSPGGTRRSVFLDDLSPPTGDTEEIGFSVEVNDKLNIRFNWFETSAGNFDAGLNAGVINSRINTMLDGLIVEPLNAGFTWEEAKAAMLVGFDGPDPIPNINSFSEMENTILNLMPSELVSQFNWRVVNNNGLYEVESETFSGQTATAALKADGFEIEMAANPTPNWRILVNVGKQETVQSNSAPELKRLADFIRPNLDASGLSDLRIRPALAGPEQIGTHFTRLVELPLNNVLAKDGTTSLEQRKWRANLVTNYAFSNDSFLKGFGLGGAARWEDKVGIGFGQIVSEESGIIPDLSQPFFAPSQISGDVWASYQRPITERVNWKIQVNVRNAFGDDELIPVRANPDGTIPIVRIPNETTWFITNTFSF